MGYRRLHVARAGQRKRTGRPDRLVFLRRRFIRNGNRRSPIPLVRPQP